MNQFDFNPEVQAEPNFPLSQAQRLVVELLIDEAPEMLREIADDPELSLITEKLIPRYRTELLNNLGAELAAAI